MSLALEVSLDKKRKEFAKKMAEVRGVVLKMTVPFPPGQNEWISGPVRLLTKAGLVGPEQGCGVPPWTRWECSCKLVPPLNDRYTQECLGRPVIFLEQLQEPAPLQADSGERGATAPLKLSVDTQVSRPESEAQEGSAGEDLCRWLPPPSQRSQKR